MNNHSVIRECHAEMKDSRKLRLTESEPVLWIYGIKNVKYGERVKQKLRRVVKVVRLNYPCSLGN
jgi:hypothetical protein